MEDMVTFVARELAAAGDREAAVAMARYMKTDMPFYGVKKPARVPVMKAVLSDYPIESRTGYEAAVRALWNRPHREEKYLAIGLAEAYPDYVTLSSVPLYRTMIVQGAWWDFVDAVAANLVGRVLLEQRSRMSVTLDRWIEHDDMWLRRTAIIAQLRHKAATDEARLFRYCLARSYEKEFFIRKAIGWALREYAKTAPDEVRRFVLANRDAWSGLTYREATKHLDVAPQRRRSDGDCLVRRLPSYDDRMNVDSTSDEARQRWDERYETKGFVWGVDPNRFVAEQLSGLSPRRVLDLGSGQGRNAVWLATQGHVVTAVDLSPVATEQARQLAAEAGVEATFLAEDLLAWEPTAASFDVVLLSYLQLPEPARRAVHAKAIRALAPGGRVVVIAHHRDNLERGVGGPPSPEVLFTEDDLAADFARLEVETLQEVIRPVDLDGETQHAIDVLLMAVKSA